MGEHGQPKHLAEYPNEENAKESSQENEDVIKIVEKLNKACSERGFTIGKLRGTKSGSIIDILNNRISH